MKWQKRNKAVFEIGYASDVGSRAYQEDHLGFREYPDGSILAVLADGMGGHHGGAIASELAIQWFGEYFPQTHGSIPSRLETTLRQTQQQLCEHAQQNPHLQDMGSTLLAVYVKENLMHWLSVGDSLLYQLDESEMLQQRNTIHTLGQRFQQLWESGKISRQEWEKVSNPHALTSALGPEKLHEYDIRHARFLPGHTLIIASDGLLSLMPDQIQTLLDKQSHAQALAERLLAATLAKRCATQDNIGLIVLKHPVIPSYKGYWLAAAGATLVFGALAGVLYQWHQAEQQARREHERLEQQVEAEALQRQEAEQKAQEEQRKTLEAEQKAADAAKDADFAKRQAKKAQSERDNALKKAEEERKQRQVTEKQMKEREAQQSAPTIPPQPPSPPRVVPPTPPSQPVPNTPHNPDLVRELSKDEVLP